MSQYVYSMLRVSKVVPPQKTIIKDISLSFFPGAKIGLLGLNGAGKSTVLRIMAGVDKEFEGEAVPMSGINIGYLPQEPELDPEKTVREEVESGLGEVAAAQKRLEEVYALYAEPDADFDALAEEQGKLEAIIAAGSSTGGGAEHELEIAADALRLPDWDAKIGNLSGGENAAWPCANCCSPSPICCCSMSLPTTWMPNRWNGWSSFWFASPALWWR